MLRQHQEYWTMKLLSEICMFTVLLATLAAASDDDGIDSTDEKADEGGTPIYDWSHHRWGSAETLTSSFLLVFIGLFGFSVVSSYYIGHVVRCTLFPEAAVVLTIGMIAGGLAILMDPDGSVVEDLMQFSPTVFFVGLLPPIIFTSGYTVHKRHFFPNFGAIAAYAVVGTLFSTLFIGFILYGLSAGGVLLSGDHNTPSLQLAECLTFGALISATDPVSTLAVFAELKVDPNLFYLVFGESVLNDAVGVVLFNTFAKFVGYDHGVDTVFIAAADFLFIFGGSLVVGYLVGCLAGLATKCVNFRDDKVVEMGAYALLMYLPYFVAEAIEMSGIVATLFAGMTCRHYAHANLSPDSQATALFLFKLAAYVTETAIFLALGLSVFRLDFSDSYDGGLIAWAIVLCLLARAFHVYPLSFLLNRARGPHEGRIEANQQHVIWFSGLRGAVAFACAQVFPDANGHRELFLITTMSVVLFTVFTMGCGTVPVLKYLRIETGVDEHRVGAPPPSSVTMRCLEFDHRYVMPLLTGYQPGGAWIREQHELRQEAVSTGEGEEGGDEYNGNIGHEELSDGNSGNGGSSRSASTGSRSSSTSSTGSSSGPGLGLASRGAAAASGGRGGRVAQHETELASSSSSSSSLSLSKTLSQQSAPWVRLPGSPPGVDPDTTEEATTALA